MTEYFKELNSDEYRKLKDAVSLIAVMIAGADGDIDTKETAWAEKIARIRTYNSPEEILGFYKEVGLDFKERLEAHIEELPGGSTERVEIISGRLAQLNDVLAKLNPEMGALVYRSFTSFAKHVAKASGGFLGFFSISSEESSLIELPMINPIAHEG